MPSAFTTRAPRLTSPFFWTKNRWYLAPIRWAYVPILAVIVLTVLAGISYAYAVLAFIEKSCPYTYSKELQRDNDDLRSIKFTAAELWDFACGRL